ncbi:MAG: M15 family metallopeptidase [Actinomycetota bacterium]
MIARRAGSVVLAAVLGFGAGAMLTFALQGTAAIPEHAPVPVPTPSPLIGERPDTFLAWTPGALPAGFASAVAGVPVIRRAVVVASDNAWLTRSVAANGELVDDPPRTFAIPLEVAAVDPRSYAPFLPPADRVAIVALADGQGVLGESSAKLRGLGVGAVLRFGPVRVEVAAILPDELLGAHELLVSREIGRRIGVVHDRYALLVTEGEPNERQVAKAVRRSLAPGTLVRVRAPGETPYFRHGDAVLPPVAIKELFGEFAAKPRSGAPGFLTLDPAWLRTHIVTERVPLLGEVTCNAALFPQIRGAIREVRALGLEDTITSYSGCFAPRHINRFPTAGLSHHSWGIALDVNVPQNYYGQTPDQDPDLVAVFEDWGFIWGGDFIVPDGMHFEYRRPPAGR